jgi:2,3-bisphosphoglycerate-independent phosphoglycerate mutase
MNKKRLLLIILDGFGYSESINGNATAEAKFFWELFKKYPSTLLKTHGNIVGIPEEQSGNSEVGHLAIGAGRTVKQSLSLISEAISSGSIESNPELLNFLEQNKNGTIHVMGLFSNGGAHSHLDHFSWIVNFIKRSEMNVNLHIFLDGRDVGNCEGLADLKNSINSSEIDSQDIASMQGRFFAMDRDNRIEERTSKSFYAIKFGKAEHSTDDFLGTLEGFYAKGLGDEVIPPVVKEGYSGFKDNDSAIIINFRPDRIQQIASMFVDSGVSLCSMTNINSKLDEKMHVIFRKEEIKNTLAEVLAKNGIRQLRIAETEKYHHVTYFFNGGTDRVFEFEDRILVPSPKVESYSECPHMSSDKISEIACKNIESREYDFILLNFANADMVGHTGDEGSTRESVRRLDEHLRKITKACETNKVDLIITADHGNAENMVGANAKNHTHCPVPFVFIPSDSKSEYKIFDQKSLIDIAPTVLELFKIGSPEEIKGSPIVI